MLFPSCLGLDFQPLRLAGHKETPEESAAQTRGDEGTALALTSPPRSHFHAPSVTSATCFSFGGALAPVSF